MKKILITILLVIISVTGFDVRSADAAGLELAGTALNTDANLKSYWKLENVTDEKGVTSLTNVNTVAFNTGKFGNSADFSSTNSSKYLYTATGTMTGGGAYSIGGWINIETLPSSGQLQTIFEHQYKDLTTGHWEVLYYRNAAGTLRFQIQSYTGTINCDYTLTSGVFYHYVYNDNGTTQKLYINGVACANSTTSTTRAGTTSEWTKFGDTNPASNYWFKGHHDDFFIMNRALTETEITNLATGEASTSTVSALYSNDLIYFE